MLSLQAGSQMRESKPKWKKRNQEKDIAKYTSVQDPNTRRTHVQSTLEQMHLNYAGALNMQIFIVHYRKCIFSFL